MLGVLVGGVTIYIYMLYISYTCVVVCMLFLHTDLDAEGHHGKQMVQIAIGSV